LDWPYFLFVYTFIWAQSHWKAHSPTWQCRISVVWDKDFTHHSKIKSDERKINGSHSLQLLLIGLFKGLTSRQGQSKVYRSLILSWAKALSFLHQRE
jgi:hypothetical protein